MNPSKNVKDIYRYWQTALNVCMFLLSKIGTFLMKFCHTLHGVHVSK